MVPAFCGQALRGEPLTVHGDGAQTRSLCYVDDVVEGILSAMFSAGTRGRIYNLGQAREHSVLEFAQLIVRLSGSASEIVHVAPRAGDIERRKPDVSRAKCDLGWVARTPLEDGLARTLDWYRAELATERVPMHLRERHGTPMPRPAR
jgi:nucleoside-diphosphate-sugar epimerase